MKRSFVIFKFACYDFLQAQEEPSVEINLKLMYSRQVLSMNGFNAKNTLYSEVSLYLVTKYSSYSGST
jgi:hypothetical protein